MELLQPGIGLLFWQIVVFAIVFLILAAFVWKPVARVLEERDQGILRSFEEAHDARAQAVKAEKNARDEYRKAAEEAAVIVENAHKEAEDARVVRTAEASRDAERIIEEGRRTVESQRKGMMGEFNRLLVVHAVHIAEILLKKSLQDPQAHHKLIDQYMRELDKSSQ